MKVGTDSILLGAWVALPGLKAAPKRVLDIGCGCGLLGLMLAQRTAGKAEIIGVEIDELAAQQAAQNVAQSPWPQSMTIHSGDISDFTGEPSFDVIISNPPYFINSLQGPQASRNTARHTDTLTQQQLLLNAARLLTDDGVFYLILPVDAAKQLLQISEAAGLFLHQLAYVHTKQGKPVHRYLMAFARSAAAVVESTVVDIYDVNNQYSNQFIALTRDFYLNR